MAVSGGWRRSPWLWAVVVSCAALVCAVALAVGSALTVGKSRAALGQSRHEAAPPPAPLRLGGPFLDPIPALPRALWTTPPEGLFPGGATPSFAAANQEAVLLTSPLDVRKQVYGLVVLDARTGAKKWEKQVQTPFYPIDCALSGDSRVMCWRDNALDTPSHDGVQAHTTQLMFVSPTSDGMRQAALSDPGEARVVPLRDGFLVFKDPFIAQGASSVASAFSGSGDQRWKAQGVGGRAELAVAEELGLFSIGDGNVSQVFQLSDGRETGDFSNLKSSAATDRQVLRVRFHAGGFTAENGKVMDVFNAKGKKVNQIAGWRSLPWSLGAASETCGKILLGNDSGALAAADAASGQILWQLPGPDGAGFASLQSAACVGERFLLRVGFEKTAGVYELASGKRVGAIPLGERDPSVIGTDGAFVLLRRGGPADVYDVYDLADGAFVWSSPPGDGGQYLFCASRGEPSRAQSLMSGAIYVVVGKSVSRLGQKP